MELLFLIPVIFLSAILSGAFSMGGGILALSTFSLVLDSASLIPVHGMVQLTSNMSRTVAARRHVRLKPVLYFALGTICGAILGRFFLLNIPPQRSSLLFALGILLFTWLPTMKKEKKSGQKSYIVAGGLAGYLSLFLGVSGPIIAPFYLHDKYNKESLVATKSASQVFTHACKLGVFFSLGLLNGEMFRTALIFIPFVIGGNLVGQKLLGKLPERFFMLAIKILISLLAFRMLYKAFI